MVYFNGLADFDGQRVPFVGDTKYFLAQTATAVNLFFFHLYISEVNIPALLKNIDLILRRPVAMCTLHSAFMCAFLLTVTTFAIFRPFSPIFFPSFDVLSHLSLSFVDFRRRLGN